MTTPSKAPTLPAAEVAILTQLQTESLPLLRARVRLLREAGWTLAQIGTPLGKNRSTTRLWQTGAFEEHLDDAGAKGPIPLPPPRASEQRVIHLYPDVPSTDRDELHSLATLARSVRGWMKEEDPARVAAHKLEDKLVMHHKMGVPYKRLADYMGVTHRAVAARLERVAKRNAHNDPRKPYQVSIEDASRSVA